MSDEIAFSRGPARRPPPRITDPVLQWSSGLPTTNRQLYAGWLVEAGKHPALDEAMGLAGFDQVRIKHGTGNIVCHWALPIANLFVVADGVQPIAELKQTNERFGIAFAWRVLENGRGQSVMRFRAFVRELMAVGYTEPLLVSVKSTLTGDLITALLRQYAVLDALALFRRHAGKSADHLPFYACSIALGPGVEVQRGSVQTKEITPMVALVPEPVSRDYIRQQWIKREWVGLIERITDATIAWSVRESAAIGAGEACGEEER